MYYIIAGQFAMSHGPYDSNLGSEIEKETGIETFNLQHLWEVVVNAVNSFIVNSTLH